MTAHSGATATTQAAGAPPAAFDSDSLAHRNTIRRAMLIGAWVWPVFTLLDLYMCVVLYPGAPLPLFLVYRVVVEVQLVWVYRVARRPQISNATLDRLQKSGFFLAALFISLMALHLGGAQSVYMHGVSIVCLVRAAVIPEPWQRSAGEFAILAITFPLVMTVASLVSDDIRAGWFTTSGLAVFAASYVFVVASAAVGMASGHAVWAAQQQVYKARRLGRYRLQAPLGKGGMGEVWLAWDAPLSRNVALKILRTSGIPDIESVKRFEREARSASRLRVPHTIQVFDFGASDDGVYYIAMEFLPGVDLRRLLDRDGAVPPARAIHFVTQACLSLEEAHEAGIIHRDIKPQNLFITRVGDEYDFLKLLDFGIAQFVATDETTDLTRTGVVRGTPAFLAPELWRGAKADPRTDLYALGATLYCLLTGAPPFRGNVGDLLRAHATTTPAAPSTRTRGPIPPGLDDLVLRCLAKSPDERFQSAQELRQALNGIPLSRRWTADDARACWREMGPLSVEAASAAVTPIERG